MARDAALNGPGALLLAAYLGAIVYVGWRAALRRREGLEDYLLAGRSLTLPSFVATLVPSFFGGVMGVGEFTYRFGLSNWVVQGLPYYVFALLYAWLLVPKVRAGAGRTLPDHVESAYGPAAAAVAALWVAALASPADELLMLGTFLRWGTGWPLSLCVWGVAAAGLSFLAMGGLRADLWTNRLELPVMFGGFFVILPFALGAAGGWSGLQAQLPELHKTWLGGNGVGYALTWFFIAFWTFVDPTFHQRVCAAKDAGTARRGIVISVAFWFCFDLMTTSAGLCARVLLPELRDPLLAYPELGARLLPPLARGLFLAGMCSSTLAALAAGGFISATSLAKDAAGRLWEVPPGRQELWVRWGLLFVGCAGSALALALPSVVSLWYAVGSAAVPGLLVPMLSVYFERLRMTPRAALACSALGGGVSISWLLLGHVGGPGYPLGVEPFYPGLAVSLLIWRAGRLRAQ